MKKQIIRTLPLARSILLASALCILPATTWAEGNDFDLAAQEAALLAELKAGLNNSAPDENNNTKTEKVTDKTKPIGQAKKAVLKKNKEEGSVKKVGIQAQAEQSSITPKASLAITDDKNSKSTAKPAAQTARVQTPTERENSAQGSSEAKNLRANLAESEQRVTQLMDKLKEQRNDLIIAEAEVARLSRLLEKQRHATLKNVTGYSITPNNPAKDARIAATTPLQAEKMTPDMTIATISVSKANLRTGPGKNNSPLMTVSKGTRLAVETRKGEWYRVIAPTGARAWVASEVVSFGKDRLSEPTRTVQVKGYSDNAEEDAIQLIRQTNR